MKKKKDPYPTIEYKIPTSEELYEWLTGDTFPIKPAPFVVGKETLKLLNDWIERECRKTKKT